LAWTGCGSLSLSNRECFDLNFAAHVPLSFNTTTCIKQSFVRSLWPEMLLLSELRQNGFHPQVVVDGSKWCNLLAAPVATPSLAFAALTTALPANNAQRGLDQPSGPIRAASQFVQVTSYLLADTCDTIAIAEYVWTDMPARGLGQPRGGQPRGGWVSPEGVGSAQRGLGQPRGGWVSPEGVSPEGVGSAQRAHPRCLTVPLSSLPSFPSQRCSLLLPLLMHSPSKACSH